ncbi:hypothetical protein, partial [Plasmodium yoelii yoelii]
MKETIILYFINNLKYLFIGIRKKRKNKCTYILMS